MKKLALLLCLALGMGTAWAGVTGTTNPFLFEDTVDWCVQYGCNNDYTVFPTPQSFISQNGVTGSVGLVGTLQGFYNLQEDYTWSGFFPSGMGLIYDGVAFGNIPTQIAATFDVGVKGAGAWIQGNYYGDTYLASIELFDSSYQSLGQYWVTVDPYSAVFIGAFGNSVPVWAAQFDIYDQTGDHDQDFAIGTLKVSSVPEPSSLLLLGSSALGLAGVLRRRFKGVL